jgi:hypothetical protein
VLEQPIISETTSGSWVYSVLDYHLAGASFQSIEGDVERRGWESCKLHFNPILCEHPVPPEPEPSLPNYAFRFITNWDLTLPILSGALDGLRPSPPAKSLAAAVTKTLLDRLPWP